MSDARFKEAEADGLAAAKAGKPFDALNSAGYNVYDLDRRNGWICGWRKGGGDISLGVVVTVRQLLLEARVYHVSELAKIDAKLSALDAKEVAS